ncbi:MAG TPA: hypothetical protein VFG81_14505 [Anaerolineales bacterium]|jgi:hypothetical protein|nr:hypothetical protein [Anaerolineales bacterium]
MDGSEYPTCGKGLAENSVVPARVSQLISAMAENLQVHMKALDLNDPNSRAEYDVYEILVNQLRQAATQLEATASQMAGHRDLPMGRHDEQAMTHPRIRETFEKLIEQKQKLLSLLQQTEERDSELLEMMRS